MRTQYDTLLTSDSVTVEKPSGSNKPLCIGISSILVGALLVTAWMVDPQSINPANSLNVVDGEDIGEHERVVMYLKSQDVLSALTVTDEIPTHLVLTDYLTLDEEKDESIKARLSMLQAEGMSLLLEINANKVEQLRTDFPTYHAELTAAIVSWKADGVDMDGTKCPPEAGFMCSTADLMRLVSSIRSDMPRDFIVTVSPGAHQVFGSEHASRQVLRDLVLKQEVNDEIDWLNVHFAGGWTEDLGSKIVNSMLASDYEGETIVPIMPFDAYDGDDYLSLEQIKEKFGLHFGGFGTDYTNKDF